MNSKHSAIDRVTVIIAAYNGEPWIGEALDSVGAQDFTGEIETIVVDDGSTDETADIAESHSGVRVIRQTNAGQSLARNAGIEMATGQAILFLDQDDVLLPDAISLNAGLLERHTEATVIGGNKIPFSGDAASVARPTVRPKDIHVRPRSYFEIMRGDSFVPPSVCLFRTGPLRSTGGFRSLRMADDMDLYARSAKTGRLLAHTEPVVLYRRHQKNFSNNIGFMMEDTLILLGMHEREAAGDVETISAIKDGRAHWVRLFGPRLPMDAIWSLKDRRFANAVTALKIWAQLGFPFR